MTTTSSLLVLIIMCSLIISNAASDEQTYIVYMGDRPKDNLVSASFLHTDMLQQVLGSRGPQSLIRSYQKSFNGFVARMTEEESATLASMEGVVSVFPNRKKQLLTTRSWEFLGLGHQVKRAGLESDVIIGVLDTGIWPESDSFSDHGLSPPPSKWKVTCEAFSNFTCNKKIIGARYYRSNTTYVKGDIKSPRDTQGHGTHTASTAAGTSVNNASLYGLASGTARGGVPAARLAVYKICWLDGCFDADILAAFDDAIADGVDIISISVGGNYAVDYLQDSIAIGAFHAMKSGILTSTCAGNSGPTLASVTGVAPWFLSVAASSIDRKFFTTVKLGNGQVYQGTGTINTFQLENGSYPLVYGADAPNSLGGFEGSVSRFCRDGSLNPALVSGKIVLCDDFNGAEEVFRAGGMGTIMQGDESMDTSFVFPLSASYIATTDYYKIPAYINSTSKANATIEKSGVIKDNLAPQVASFSSRGPNGITPEILKPDISAPGIDILAAWSEGASLSVYKGDKRVAPYNIISGTSMSCPHATGAAAYVKSFHPNWSPAAVKSALMTTASPMKDSDAEFAYGSGHINPAVAANPGLVYDAEEADYVRFLCGQGYNDKALKLVTGDKTSGCSLANNGSVYDLNYPSFAVSLKRNEGVSTTRVFKRTVTNVGSPVSTYKAVMDNPTGLKVVVSPTVLTFKSLGQKMPFTVTVSSNTAEAIVSGSLVWEDGVHTVRSPILVHLTS